jgi:hypothetical protein
MNDDEINAIALRMVLSSLSADEDSFTRAMHDIPPCPHCWLELVRCLVDWCAMFAIRSEDGHGFTSCVAATARMEQLIVNHLDQTNEGNHHHD